MEQRKIVNKKVEELLKKHLSFKVYVKSDISYYGEDTEKDLHLTLEIPDNNNRVNLGSDVIITFIKRDNSNSLTRQGYMAVNYGSNGAKNRMERDGVYKKVGLLIGKVWELENEFTQIFKDIDWKQVIKDQEQRDINHKKILIDRNNKLISIAQSYEHNINIDKENKFNIEKAEMLLRQSLNIVLSEMFDYGSKEQNEMKRTLFNEITKNPSSFINKKISQNEETENFIKRLQGDKKQKEEELTR